MYFPMLCPIRNTGYLHCTVFHNFPRISNSAYTHPGISLSQQFSRSLGIYAIPMSCTTATIPKSLTVGIAA